MKIILEGQPKNKLLFENSALSEQWAEPLVDVNLSSKILEPGLRPHVRIDGVYAKVQDFGNKSVKLLELFRY